MKKNKTPSVITSLSPVTCHISLFAVIMAGGEGTRFHPISTSERPKQFLNFIGDKSFIRQTFERVLPLVSPERIFVATNERYIGLVKEQLPELSVDNIIGEPCKKNTAPALVYVTSLIRERHGDAVICCLPSDHYIKDENGFRGIIKQAYELADSGYLVTLGMRPLWPSTEYGYICPATRHCEGEVGEADCRAVLGGAPPHVCHLRECGDLPQSISWFPVKSFAEKPKKELADRYIKEGYLWNGGIFVWKADTFLNEVANHVPNLLPITHCSSPITYFKKVPSISIDYAIMEKSDRVAVIPADIGWSDVGNWDSVEKLMSEGVNIAPHICAVMKGDEENPHRRIVPKPWGHEEWWAHTDKYVGKILFIKKGSRLSLQYHKVKEETLRLLSGELDMELSGGKIQPMKQGDVYHIPPETIHRMSARSDCLMLEVSTPEVEDVVRVKDDYGR